MGKGEKVPRSGDSAKSAASSPSAPFPQLPSPRILTSGQALFFVAVLTLGIAGWVLFLSQRRQSPALPPPSTPLPSPAAPVQIKVSPSPAASQTYTPRSKKYLGELVSLPAPRTKSGLSLEEALSKRRSRRQFADQTITLEDLSQILWAAQGVTEPAKGYRTAPSARAIYPLNLYAVVRRVAGLQPGLYHYVPEGHKLGPLMIEAGLLTDKSQQSSVRKAPVVLVYGAVYAKAQEKFPGEAGVKVTLQESGHIAQNVYLQVESLGLATVVVGGFNPEEVKKALDLPAEETVVYLQPFGLRAE